MKTVICEQPGTLVLTERPAPVPGSNDVLIRIKRVGVCGTDLHIFTGNQPYLAYPRVMGHELSGIVESAPRGARVEKGDQVYIMPYLACGTCVACRAGKSNCCMNIRVLGVHTDGGMVEQLAVPQEFVFKAKGVTLDQAAMIEFLAIGAHAVARADVQPKQRALVVGAGPIGMAALIFSLLRGAEVTVLDGREDRLKFCETQLSVHHAVRLDTSGAATDAKQLAELMINADLSEFIFNHGDAFAVILGENAVQQGRLAGAKKTGNDGDGNTGGGTGIHIRISREIDLSRMPLRA